MAIFTKVVIFVVIKMIMTPFMAHNVQPMTCCMQFVNLL